jgi:exonuclease III
MAKAFSVASWNVEHFGKNAAKRKNAIEFLAQNPADIVAVYEVVSKEAFRPIVEAMPKYQFHITEGPQVQEILVGIRQGFSAYVTQRLEFKGGQATLRPGVLVTLHIDDAFYSVVFLHLKSAPDPRGFGLRDDMMRRAFKFRRTLDKLAVAADGANYVFVGDLNTMGLDYPFKQHDISGEDEIKELERRAKLKTTRMKVLGKNAPATWWNGLGSRFPPSNLDHVVASQHLNFKKINGAEVDVRGWPKEPDDQAKTDWINKHSDHGLLFFEVQKV